MTSRDWFRLTMRERRQCIKGTPEYDWRTRAARKYLWMLKGIPTKDWPE